MPTRPKPPNPIIKEHCFIVKYGFESDSRPHHQVKQKVLVIWLASNKSPKRIVLISFLPLHLVLAFLCKGVANRDHTLMIVFLCTVPFWNLTCLLLLLWSNCVTVHLFDTTNKAGYLTRYWTKNYRQDFLGSKEEESSWVRLTGGSPWYWCHPLKETEALEMSTPHTYCLAAAGFLADSYLPCKFAILFSAIHSWVTKHRSVSAI